jgi:hypothetical protein
MRRQLGVSGGGGGKQGESREWGRCECKGKLVIIIYVTAFYPQLLLPTLGSDLFTAIFPFT